MAEDVAQVREKMEAAAEPFGLFAEWMEAAKASEVNDPDAMALATCTPEGVPSVRMVLLKRFDKRGFAFFTNGDSRKGGELRANQHAALCLHWKKSAGRIWSVYERVSDGGAPARRAAAAMAMPKKATMVSDRRRVVRVVRKPMRGGPARKPR